MKYLNLLMLLCLWGCGAESSSSQLAGDLSKPLQGHPVEDRDELEGAWMAVSDGQFGSLEFLSNGSVLVVQGFTNMNGQAMTMQYQLLEGGRLSLIGLGGRTSVLQAIVDDEWLELSEQLGGQSSQRFRKVDSGPALLAERQTYLQQLALEREQILVALGQSLSREHLLLKSSDSKVPLPPILLNVKLTDGRTFSGTAVTDIAGDDPQVFDVRGQLLVAMDNSANLDFQLTGRVDTNSQARRMRGHLRLIAGGDPLQLAGALEEGNDALAVVLEKDKLTAQAILARVEEVVEQKRRAIAMVTDALGVRTVLKGSALRTAQGQLVPVSIILERMGQQSAYIGTAVFGQDNFSSKVRSEIDVLSKGDDKVAIVQLHMDNNNHWRLSVSDKGLSGTWYFGNSVLEGKSAASDLRIDQTWNEEQLSADKAKMQAYLDKTLSQPQQFSGLLTMRDEAMPLWLSLHRQSDGSLSGMAKLQFEEVSVELQGSIKPGSFSPQLLLHATKVQGSTMNLRKFGRQDWQLELLQADEPMRLSGRVKLNLSSGEVLLAPVDEHLLAEQKRQLIAVLSGQDFILTTDDRPRTEQTYVRLTLDPATDKLSGAIFGARLNAVRHPAHLSGQLVTEQGQHMLRLHSVHDFKGHSSMDFALFADWSETGVVLKGPVLSNSSGTYLTLRTTADKVSIPADQALLIEAYALGASEYPPSKPEAGQSAYLYLTGRTRGALYGTDVYLFGSDVAVAAVHAGVLEDGQSGIVKVHYQNQPEQLQGSSRYGVASKGYESNGRKAKGPSFRLALVKRY
ncbi:LCCL domain-containing protein [Bowmanella yangjiangensis]|uniref:LCCL domain-containing protein n=1 Tax=Bowmanella yangjiangensis TaxID=2811230 RepID=A0ABS3CSV1_9ALTE|nr:LCCL domain-containing protein [Bowmanella yangjiangensis]MBN7820197.1 hypothetical protein [Bowmanella yangjiangensis]